MSLKNAFTLIELLVVIAIIGILSGLIVVSMSGVTVKARMSKAQVFNNSLKNALLLNVEGEWSLDGTPDDVWSHITGTAINAPTVATDCTQNTCYTFNGTTQYITTPNTGGQYSIGTNGATAMVWVKGVAQSGKTFFANWDDTATTYKAAWKIYSGASGGLSVTLVDSADPTNKRKVYVASNVVLDNTWHLVGFSWTGASSTGVLSLYIDGETVPAANISKTDTGTIVSLDANGSTAYAVMAIGCSTTNNSPATCTAGTYFAGSLDSARLYNAVIPTSRIQEEYYAGLNNLLSTGRISAEEYSQRISTLSLNN